MATTLITGASGYIGKSLALSLSSDHEVLCMSRRDPGLNLPWFRGDFSSFEDLRQLDSHKIDALIHLGAVTGGCLERDGILVNVEGTRCLMRYLIDRGTKKFVMASSIAAIGFQSVQFRPLEVPIPDEHACLDRDGYGVSKYLMEELTKYLHLQNPQIDVINLRLSTVPPENNLREIGGIKPIGPWCLGGITKMALSDAVRVFTLAAESPLKAGVRIMNAVAPVAWVGAPVADILRNWWGNDVDVTHFEQPGHQYDSVFRCDRIKEELGFVAHVAPPR